MSGLCRCLFLFYIRGTMNLHPRCMYNHEMLPLSSQCGDDAVMPRSECICYVDNSN